MSNLAISKNTEALAVSMIWNMGVESLDPESYERLEDIFKVLCDTRHIDFKTVGMEHKTLSERKRHVSDCSTNSAPAYLPSPCDCDGY